MKFFAVAFMAIILLACNNATGQKANLKTKQDSLSYAIGVNLGKNVKRDEIKLTPELVTAGIMDAMKSDSTMLTDAQISQLFQDLQKDVQKKTMEKQMKAGEENTKKGQEFLENNKKQKDIKITASGLQYKVVKEGTGKSPVDGDMVKVHYKGTLIDGTKFDSSYDRNEPTEFGVNQVIPGWTEALKLMKEGSKYMLYIPSELAYGQRGAGATIGPNAVLVFEVELLEVKPGAGKQ